ncbi:hypothetical protein NECAME_04160 [Necator americanus]|uniref:Uncharacterized protein n=1 Tax=Necator americanus TaxID=51031 RepID=W2SYV3_NECAM|nr:hypothetical protein NECAME_04160 [Necator americanus]ETN74131.1 hypothetical protein NECAME_04160 [Necator americanus]
MVGNNTYRKLATFVLGLLGTEKPCENESDVYSAFEFRECGTLHKAVEDSALRITTQWVCELAESVVLLPYRHIEF